MGWLGQAVLLSIWNQSIISTRKVNTVTCSLAISSKVTNRPALVPPKWLWWFGSQNKYWKTGRRMGRAFSLTIYLGRERIWRHWSTTGFQVVGVDRNTEMRGRWKELIA